VKHGRIIFSILLFFIKGANMKKNKKLLLSAFILFCFFGISTVFADPSCMRCQRGNKMVCVGASASTVIAKCGSPLSAVEIGSKTRSKGSGTMSQGTKGSNDYRTKYNRSSTELKLEEWTYCIEGSYGSDCYLYILRF